MAAGIQVVIDCADPAGLGAFWADALGYVEQPPPPGFDSWDAALDAWSVPADRRNALYAIVDPDGAGPRVLFQQVPEAKTVKNRVHLDVSPAGASASPDERWTAAQAKAAELVARGAVEVDRHEELGSRWIVMLDPAGNEFCVH